MANKDKLMIRKFDIDEIVLNKKIFFKVTFSIYIDNLLETDNQSIVYKKFRDFLNLYKDCVKLKSIFYLKEDVPIIPEINLEKEFKKEEIENQKILCLNLLEYFIKYPCLYKNKIFVNFFKTSFNLDNNLINNDNILFPSINLTNNNFELVKSDSIKNNLFKTDNLKNVNEAIEEFPIPFESNNLEFDYENLKEKFIKNNYQSKLIDTSERYLIDAATLICQAQTNEEKREFETAFESYKCAISILLKGAKSEKDRFKKMNVKKKIEKYLNRAEEIRNNYLNKNDGKSKYSLNTPKKQILDEEIKSDKNNLSRFKLLSFDKKIQIVYDLKLNEKFALKVVHKYSDLDDYLKYFIFPKNIPNMINLNQIYKTEYAFYLILDFYNCTKLSDVLTKIRQHLSPCVECVFNLDNQTKISKEFSNSINDLTLNDNEENIIYTKRDSLKTFCRIDNESLKNDYLDKNSPLFFFKEDEKLKLSKLKNSKSFNFDNESIAQKDCNAFPPFNTITNIFGRARSLIKNVDQTIRSNSIEQAKLSLDNITLQCNLNNYILEKINDKMLGFYYCDEHLNQQLIDIDEKLIFSENLVKNWLQQIIIALEDLHSKNILYVDLSPSKILLGEDLSKVTLAYKYSLDFRKISENQNLDPSNLSQLIVSTFYSTNTAYSSSFSYYIAPEFFVFGTEITCAVDWWSLGVLAYELLSNRPLCSFIPSIECKKFIQFPDRISLEAKDLIEKLLQINPVERLGRFGVDEIKLHPFFAPLGYF